MKNPGKSVMKMFATKMLAAVLTLLLPGLMVPAAAQAQELVRAPAGSEALDDAWQWALAELSTRSGWIAWQISSTLDEKIAPVNYYGNVYAFRGLSVDAMLAGNVRAQQAFPRQQELLVMILVERGMPSRLEVTSPQHPQQWRYPVYWLGEAGTEESFSLLRAELDPAKPVNVVTHLLYAIGLHNHPDRTAFLNSLYTTEAWKNFRTPILASLALQQSSETEQLMLEIAADDLAGVEEREAAIRALASYDSAAAVALLRSMTDEGEPPVLREEAIEALAYFAGGQVETLLRSLAWDDNHFRIREAAVESLADLASASARAQLLEIARDHPSADTRDAALESLLDELF
jgi:hypothetical protein